MQTSKLIIGLAIGSLIGSVVGVIIEKPLERALGRLTKNRFGHAREFPPHDTPPDGEAE